jgi:hypothetical protein
MQEKLYTDIDLLDRLRSDDTVCFEELYHRHWRMVYFYALKKLYSREDARRVVMLVFAEIWSERYQIPVDISLPVLLYQKVRVAVVQQLHHRLSSISQAQWIDGYVLPYFGGEQPEMPAEPFAFEAEEARETAFSVLMQRNGDRSALKNWISAAAEIWHKPKMLLSRNH